MIGVPDAHLHDDAGLGVVWGRGVIAGADFRPVGVLEHGSVSPAVAASSAQKSQVPELRLTAAVEARQTLHQKRVLIRVRHRDELRMLGPARSIGVVEGLGLVSYKSVAGTIPLGEVGGADGGAAGELGDVAALGGSEGGVLAVVGSNAGEIEVGASGPVLRVLLDVVGSEGAGGGAAVVGGIAGAALTAAVGAVGQERGGGVVAVAEVVVDHGDG